MNAFFTIIFVTVKRKKIDWKKFTCMKLKQNLSKTDFFLEQLSVGGTERSFSEISEIVYFHKW